eukprot:gene4194-14297_t
MHPVHSHAAVILASQDYPGNNRPLEGSACENIARDMYTVVPAPVGGGLGPFQCNSPPFLTMLDGNRASFMGVCAQGTVSAANLWQKAADTASAAADKAADTLSAAADVAVYLSYHCGLFTSTAASCGTGGTSRGANCEIKLADFPHQCFPGNSNRNGGSGTPLGQGLGGTPYQCFPRNSNRNGGSGTPLVHGLVGTPYQASDWLTHPISFSLLYSTPNCPDMAPLDGGPNPCSCCDMIADKLEIIINYNCFAAVEKVMVNSEPAFGSYGNISYFTVPQDLPLGYPDKALWYESYKITSLHKFRGESLDVSITLRPGPCGTAATFLPNGLLWYAFFNSAAEFSSNCCGTYAIQMY